MATVDASGMVTPVAVGSCIITATAIDGSGVSGSCAVTIAPILNGHEYVDLGLPSGTLWATCNVGSSSPTDYGDHFAWGETAPKAEYSEDNYAFGTVNHYVKYGYNKLLELLPEDDAAYVNWGPIWRMPTHEQQVELVDTVYTDVVWVRENNILGRRITSKVEGYAGNSIFLPSTGFYCDSTYYDGDGYYWSRELYPNYSDGYAHWLYFTQSLVQTLSRWSSVDRHKGMCVRPVVNRDSVQ